jgi:hypothetical protein
MMNGHNVDAGSGRQMIDCAQALGRKVCGVVGKNVVAENANVAATLPGQVRRIENAQAAGVVGGDVVIDVDVLGVFSAS